MLCYVTPKDHLGLPNKQDLRDGVIAYPPTWPRHPGTQARDGALGRRTGQPPTATPIAQVFQEESGPPTVAAPALIERPAPTQAPGSPSVSPQTMPLILGRRQTFTLSPQRDPAGPSKG